MLFLIHPIRMTKARSVNEGDVEEDWENSSQETSQTSSEKEETETPVSSTDRHFSWTFLVFAGSKDWGFLFVISRSLLATKIPFF